jgi:hypothetical protein
VLAVTSRAETSNCRPRDQGQGIGGTVPPGNERGVSSG